MVSAGLLLAAASSGQRAAGIKPLAAGCELRSGQLLNGDALILQEASSVKLDYELVNPVALEMPIAPHVAARRAGVEITARGLAANFEKFDEYEIDILVVEGAGGWLVPLNDSETMADLCVACDFPVLLVVGMRLGCLNHALLTAAAIGDAGATLTGWVANCVDPEMTALDENLQTLQARLPGRFLGVVPYLGSDCTPANFMRYLDARSAFALSS